MNFQNLQLLDKKEIVYGLPKLKGCGGICASCPARKQHRKAFNKEQVWMASQPLELIHSDVCGPLQVTAMAGNRYFFTFINDYTIMCGVYFLTCKSQVFGVFKGFKSMVELQSGY